MRVAIIGIGNCASALVQGVNYYKDAPDDKEIPRLMHVTVGGYHVRDIEFSASFDVVTSKVGLDLNEAILGGGIFSKADNVAARTNFTLNNSTISNNHADIGSGICNFANNGIGTIYIVQSTINNTAAYDGGGIYNDAANSTAEMHLNLSNSTISGNSSSNMGGVLNFSRDDTSATTIANSTFSGNAAFQGSCIYYVSQSGTATVELTNSILANAPSGGDCYNTEGTILDHGYNLVEDGSCGFSPGSDPLLQPLQDNGGPTLTHTLIFGSQVIDIIPVEACNVSTDQRGFVRPQNYGSDIGAYEYDGVGNRCGCRVKIGTPKTITVTEISMAGRTMGLVNFTPSGKGPLICQDRIDQSGKFIRYLDMMEIHHAAARTHPASHSCISSIIRHEFDRHNVSLAVEATTSRQQKSG